MSDFVISGLWRATWQGAIVFVVIVSFVKLTPRLSPTIHCWVCRLVCLKMILALCIAGVIEIPLLPAEPQVLLDGESVLEFVVPAEPIDAQQVVGPSPPVLLASRPEANFSWGKVIATVWLLGVTYQLFRLFMDWQAVHRRVAEAVDVTDTEVNKLLRSEVIEAEMSLCPRLLSASSTNCPAVIGSRRPLLLIPDSVLEESGEDDLRMLIRHELAHIRRGDLWWNWLAAASQVLFFFHPAVWWTLKEWRMSQESACDELALGGRSEESAGYASMLLEIALSKDPSRSLTYATGVFESFESLKRRIEKMSHFGTHSNARVKLAYTFVALFMLGLLPWKIVSQASSGIQAAVGGEVDNSAAHTKVDGVSISVADVTDVSKLKSAFRGDFSRLMSTIDPNVRTTKSSDKFSNGNVSLAESGFGGGAGGGAASVTKFEGRPTLAIALKVEAGSPSEFMILDGLTGTDESGETYKSLPTSSVNFMVCPEYEREMAGSVIAYFPKSVSRVSKFAKLSGTILVSTVDSDSAEFKRLSSGAKRKTKLGEYKITAMESGRDGTKIAVQFPLPMSIRDDLDSRPGDAESFQRRVKARQGLSGMVRAEFIGSDGLIYQPQSRTSHGSGEQASTFSSSSGPNGFKTSKSGGFSSRKAGVVEYAYGFSKLPANVRIVGLKARILEKPTATKEVSFELTAVNLK